MTETTATFSKVTCDECNGKRKVSYVDYNRKKAGDKVIGNAMKFIGINMLYDWLEEYRDKEIECPECLGSGRINVLD